MRELIAYCGINCNQCEAFIATKNNDEAELKRIADQASTIFSAAWAGNGAKLTIEDVMCEGCFSARLAKYCREKCVIRPCAKEKGVKNCAYCKLYRCKKLALFLQRAPKGARRLDALHKGFRHNTCRPERALS